MNISSEAMAAAATVMFPATVRAMVGNEGRATARVWKKVPGFPGLMAGAVYWGERHGRPTDGGSFPAGQWETIERAERPLEFYWD